VRQEIAVKTSAAIPASATTAGGRFNPSKLSFMMTFHLSVFVERQPGDGIISANTPPAAGRVMGSTPLESISAPAPAD
jgi:hypothetical protein